LENRRDDYEALEAKYKGSLSLKEPNQKEEERIAMGFWMVQYYMELLYAADRGQLSWSEYDLENLRTLFPSNGLLGSREDQLAGTALDFVLSTMEGVQSPAEKQYYFGARDVMTLGYVLPDPRALRDKEIWDCSNLQTYQHGCFRSTTRPALSSIGLTDDKSLERAYDTCLVSEWPLDQLQLTTAPFWKFGFFAWDSAKMEALKLLPDWDYENEEPIIDMQYVYARWRILMTTQEERRAVKLRRRLLPEIETINRIF